MTLVFSVGAFEAIGPYVFFFLGGSVLGLGLGWCLTQKIRQFASARYFDLLWVTWFLGVLGAKTVALMFSPKMLENVSFQSWGYVFEGGYHLSGGLIVGLTGLGTLVWCWKSQVQIWPALNLLLLTALPGMALGRLGCLFSGCCAGIPFESDRLWFGVLVQYPTSFFGDVAPVGQRLAVQLYDSAMMGILALFVWVRTIGRQFRCSTFSDVGLDLAIVLISFGLFRLMGDFLRDPIFRGDMRLGWAYLSQWVALCLVSIGSIVGVLWFRVVLQRGHKA